MGTNVTWNGSTYTVPATSEENWSGATKVDGLLIALATHGFQKTGGTFTLSADADFGASAGLKSIYYKSRGTVATTGVFRLANAEVIAWMNAAGNANIPLTVNASNQLTFNGTVVFSSAGVVPVAAGGTGATTAAAGFDALSPMSTLGDLIYGGASGTRTRLAGNTTTTKKYLQQQGDGAASAAPSWAQPAFSELSGNATVAQGGTNLTSFAQGDMIYASAADTLAKRTIGAAGTVWKSNGTVPDWGSPASTVASVSKTANYTITSNDDVILCDASGGSFTLTLPDCASNSGKVYKVKRTDTTFANTLTIARAGADTINGATSYVLYTKNEMLEFYSGGSTAWIVINHLIPACDLGVTPTYTNTTTSSPVYSSYRVGNRLRFSGFVDVASSTAAAFSIDLPSGIVIDSSALSSSSKGTVVGTILRATDSAVAIPDVSTGMQIIFYDGSTTNKLYYSKSVGTTAGTFTKNNPNWNGGTGEIIHINFEIPISGWQS